MAREDRIPNGPSDRLGAIISALVIAGTVGSDLDATIILPVQDANNRFRTFSTVVDTGFNGFLTLPSAVVRALRLVRIGTARALLADGQEHLIDIYEAVILRNDEPRTVAIDVTESTPLVGMAMLLGSELSIRVIEGGSVTILPIA